MIKLDENKSIAKNASIFKPKTNKNHKLETICKNFSETKINIQRISDNIHNLRDGLNLLMKKLDKIIKTADKGSVVVVLMPKCKMRKCQLHSNNENYYQCLFENN